MDVLFGIATGNHFVDATLTNGGRVLCATALGNTVAEAQKRAYALMTDIRWDGSFSRNDIGWRAIEREQR